MSKLSSYVHVVDPDGAHVAFGPDDEVPDWALAQITNPKAWAEAPVDEPEAGGSAAEQEPAEPAVVDATPADPTDPDATPAEIVPGDDGVPTLQEAAPQPEPRPAKPAPKPRRTRAASK